MQILIDWASPAKGNQILELQFQGKILEERTPGQIQCQPSILPKPPKKTRLVLAEATLKLLELKKKDGPKEPTAKEWEKYDAQLQTYVEEHKQKISSPLVVGFVLVMYDNKSAV